MSNFWKRAITGTAFVSVIIGSILAGQWVFQLLFLAVAMFTLWEFYNLVFSEEAAPQKIPGIILCVITYFSLVPAGETILPTQWWVAIVYCLVGFIFIIELYRKKLFPFHAIALTITGIVYVVLPFALLTRLASLNGSYNFSIPLGIFLLIWANDTIAYLTGMKFGKHRLFERISPKKSWEGSIGGLVFTLIAAFLLSRTFNVLSIYDWLVIAVIIVVAGTLGDLVESMLKRSMKVKDSGNILPGHGGLLDRFDALLLALPFIYIYLSIFNS